MGIQQYVFILLTFGVFYFAFRQFKVVYRNIFLGKPEKITGNTSERWKNTLLIAFGQKKMFKKWIPAFFHLFIYVAFLFTQIELIEILVDGFTGKHRFFAHYLGGFYTLIINCIELLSLLALVATIIFLYRRNLLKVPRLVKSELNGWPKLDANIILMAEILLVTGIFTMNGADKVLQDLGSQLYNPTGTFLISGWLGPSLFGSLPESSLILLERFGWWMHILVVFGFILYLPYSKHLHIFLAFPNVYFSRLISRGKMENMPEIMNEVKSMLGIEGSPESEIQEMQTEFGAKDIFDLSWKNILDAYSCTECGRCTAECPANITGKKLSPRKIMMDIRDRATEIGKNIDLNGASYLKGEDNLSIAQRYDDGKNLLSYISREELHACTTCNACVEACPVSINPLEPILKLRRYEILSESAGPSDWIPMFTAMENGGCVWQMPVDRDNWVRES